MKQKKIIIGIIVLLVAMIGAGGTYFYITTQKTNEVTLDAYDATVNSMIDNVRSGQEKWLNLLTGGGSGTSGSGTGGGIAFQDLCTGYYSEQFRTLGHYFIDQANAFDTIIVTDSEYPAYDIQNYPAYQTYFAAYRTIGERLIAFADYVDAGEYHSAIQEIEALINLYDTVLVKQNCNSRV